MIANDMRGHSIEEEEYWYDITKYAILKFLTIFKGGSVM